MPCSKKTKIKKFLKKASIVTEGKAGAKALYHKLKAKSPEIIEKAKALKNEAKDIAGGYTSDYIKSIHEGAREGIKQMGYETVERGKAYGGDLLAKAIERVTPKEPTLGEKAEEFGRKVIGLKKKKGILRNYTKAEISEARKKALKGALVAGGVGGAAYTGKKYLDSKTNPNS